MRERILSEARSWIGTPFHHGADIKGVGVDCAMLLVRVYVDLGLIKPFDPRPYTHDWHLHRGEERYLQGLLARAIEVAAPRSGDVAAFRVGRCYSHAGIVTRAAPLTLVHASLPSGVVLEEDATKNADMAAPSRKVRFFSVVEARCKCEAGALNAVERAEDAQVPQAQVAVQSWSYCMSSHETLEIQQEVAQR